SFERFGIDSGKDPLEGIRRGNSIYSPFSDLSGLQMVWDRRTLIFFMCAPLEIVNNFKGWRTSQEKSMFLSLFQIVILHPEICCFYCLFLSLFPNAVTLEHNGPPLD
ncbi:MAG: hypothetical protein CSA23_07650, partial [Deltaproteobacteria bacterium]